ncbi:signal peptidase I [Desulfobotulus alkaliphilus]|uniref:Signal peptidase I n=1 Tax=Desulfobotulus alkaliphilus TaxID=622671 RepID=A0A562RGK2_9BACT|nr:S24/S26 family peptidase [Desulfobotulus alkaliphilus]TWI68191.1 signal peptidase I [Desulfobotulus alkaliphilus]
MGEQCSETLSFSGEALLEVMTAVLENKALFRFQAKGFSMSPVIRHGDILTLASLEGEKPGVGDVVAFKNPYSPNLVIHRIVAKKKGVGFWIKGDNGKDWDGFFEEKKIMARVVRVERGGKNVWYGGSFIALLSRFGVLTLFVPLVRRMKNSLRFMG